MSHDVRRSALGKAVWALLGLWVVGVGVDVPAADDARRSPAPPNVVVFLADDQGWGDLSIHGNTNLATPRIDSIGQGGALFEHFYVCQLCAPTRAEFLTGRYHARTGVSGVSEGFERMRADEVTIADTFRKAGYATGCFGKWHNGTQPPLHPNHRGFDEFFGFTSGHWGNYFDAEVDHNGEIARSQGFLTDDLTTHAIDFVRQHRDRPFLCYVPFNTPHSPMQVPDRFYDKFARMKPAMTARPQDGEDLSMTRAALAMVENIDWNVGRMLDTLKELNLDERTIVLYFSDNGPNSFRWNGDMKGRKGSLEEGGLRSPLLMRWTGHIPAGTRIDRIAGAIDLLPTLADLAGVPLISQKPLDGLSLKPLVMGEKVQWPERTLAAFRSGNKGGGVSLRTQQYRLDPTGQLFDLVADPGQRTNVAAEHADLMARLKAEAEKHGQAMTAELGKPNRPFDVGYGPVTMLPARDGRPLGGVQRSNKAPNDSYFTHWTSKEGSMVWDVDVAATGDYEAIVTYTCPAGDVGATLELASNQGQQPKVSARITEAFDPPLHGAEHDRSDRGGESFVKEFRPLSLGRIHLDQGIARLQLRATDIPGQQVGDVKYLILKRP
jgi:arylsulfatase A-like enzyme